MRNINIFTRLFIAFTLLLTISALSTLVVSHTIDGLLGKVRSALDKSVEHERLATEWSNLVHLNGVRTIAILKDGGDSLKTMLTPELEATSKRISEIQGKLEKDMETPDEKAFFAEVGNKRKLYSESRKQALQLKTGENDAELTNIIDQAVLPAMRAYIESINKLTASQKAELDKLSPYLISEKNRIRILLLTLLGASVLVGIVFCLLISRSITRPLEAMVVMLQDIAQGDGDLTKRLVSDGKDEIGKASRDFNCFVDKIQDIIKNVSNISADVALASNQLRSTSGQIATASEEVACQTHTVATASEEMSATSSDIARNCSMAADTSKYTAESATAGAAIVQETISGMALIAERVQSSARTVEALGARSNQIGQIVGTIEDIADQTNLLALNAAIEAARAGEQGRGFAVVADEVRALAERTTRATREIGEMIKAIQKETGEAVKAMEQGVREVEKGTVTSQKSGHALNEILERINEVSMQINQIATAAEEQTATTAEVTNNIQQVTEIVQQTARGADENSTAAAQLACHAQDLHNLVSRFRLA
jgi:methyl-accepting chemotaxis protein